MSSIYSTVKCHLYNVFLQVATAFMPRRTFLFSLLPVRACGSFSGTRQTCPSHVLIQFETGVAMPSRIHILPEQLTNKIAAGEVVERPASVVKELVENSLDAGADDILVEIESGGKRLIRVTDNGCGMGRDDLLLSLERHATSKIAADDDLFTLDTLGFRGEALPSVASVARLTLMSREKEALAGCEIYAEGGRIREVKSCGMPPGTVVEVRNLFFNTPARLKFLRSPETEAGHVGDLMVRLALSRPDVRFRLVNDGKVGVKAMSRSLPERAAEVLGTALARELAPLSWEDGDIFITGLAGGGDCHRSSTGYLYTYINGRFIRDKVVQHALLQAYRSFMEKGRYPVVVLNIRLPAGDVDVNVHPTKHEVRFREQGRVHDAIMAAVTTLLRTTPWVRTTPVPSTMVPVHQPDRTAGVREALTRYQADAPRHQGDLPVPLGSMRQMEPVPPLSRAHAPVAAADATADQGFFSRLTVIGQFQAAFILCQDERDLIVIDQHAAHERVAFEQLKREFGGGSLEAQGLLFPETVELTHQLSALAHEHASLLELLGFKLEAFGGTTWLLQAVPRVLAGGGYLQALRDTLEELANVGRSLTVADAVESLLIRLACHSVVRGRHALSTVEIQSLFRQMDATDFAANCPHGRPVMARIARTDLEKLFKR
jgi:DNA mismatch repair protein MutL